MSFLDGIFNKQPAPAPAAAPVASQGGPATKQPAPANSNADPASMSGSQAAPAAGNAEVSVLDTYKDLFKPRQQDPNAPRTPTLNDPLLAPLDPAAFQQQVASANFTKNLKPDQVQKAMGGDAESFMAVINQVAQEAFSASTQLTHGLSEHAAREAATRLNGTLDGRIRQNQIRMQNSDNPALSNPAVAPLVSLVKAQIASQNANLTPAEVQQQTEQYFAGLSDAFTAPQRAAAEQAAAPKGQDWSWMASN